MINFLRKFTFLFQCTLDFFFTKLVFGSFPLGDFSIQDLKDTYTVASEENLKGGAG